MRLNLGSVAGNMPIAYFPSTAAHTQLMAPYYNEDEIIASLANFESMDDDEIYEVTARAQGAILHWQNQFYDLDDQIYRAAKGSYQRQPFFGNPRPEITTKDIPTKTALSKAVNYATGPKRTRGELTIDMNDVPEPDELPAKRVRKAPKVFDPPSAPAATAVKRKRPEPDIVESIDAPEADELPAKRVRKAPKVFDPPSALAATATKRKRQELDIVESIETAGQQPAKKRATRAPKIKIEESIPPESSKQGAARARPVSKPESLAPEPAVRRSTRAKSVTKAPSVVPESTSNRLSKTPAAPKKRSTRAKSATKEPSAAPEASQKGAKDPKRSAAMKAAWAKRKAEGRNGRTGGTPLASTVAKAGGKKGGK